MRGTFALGFVRHALDWSTDQSMCHVRRGAFAATTHRPCRATAASVGASIAPPNNLLNSFRNSLRRGNVRAKVFDTAGSWRMEYNWSDHRIRE